MYFGADYYPEHWPENRWPVDAALMKKLNFNVVRLAEFAWVKMEPDEGAYDFAWLDKAIETLAEHGIDVVLCTPTASPPNWLIAKHRDILPRDSKGIVKESGSRRHYCPSNGTYHDYTRRIVRAMAEHYKDNKSVIAWQVDNEFGCHDTARCYCDNCAKAFRAWLKEKYGTLERLNEVWGTIFWGQTFTDWKEVPLPWYNPSGHSPGLKLDFCRFASESYARYQKIQVDILREVMPGTPITHNLMPQFLEIDYFDLARDLDFVSWDSCPGFGASPCSPAIGHDICRGLKRDRPYWVMEHEVVPVHWRPVNSLLRPGIVRLWTYQSIAHGAEGILYFRWRWCLFGHENLHDGVLPQDGQPGRAYREVLELAEELQRVMPHIESSSAEAAVALLMDYDIVWALGDHPDPTNRISYWDVLFRYYEALFRIGVQIDVVHPRADLSRYKLVVAPMLYIVDEKVSRNLHSYVEEGGFLIATFFSGIADRNGNVIDKPFPGPLSDLFGITVPEYDPVPESFDNSIVVEGSTLRASEYPIDIWCDLIELKGGKPVAAYSKDFYAGTPAITINAFGKGTAVYVGTMGKDSLEKDLIRWAAESAGIRLEFAPIDGVEVRPRYAKDSVYYFVMNHNAEAVDIAVPREMIDLISHKSVQRSTTIPSYGVAILKAPR